jgi:2-phospho-L-lactate guanylyltransferase
MVFVTSRPAHGTPARHARAQWAIVVPVKSGELGKTRLLIPKERRARLAMAMAMDTIEEVAASDLVLRVLVVTEDACVASEAAAISANVAPLVVASHAALAARFPDGREHSLDRVIAHGAELIGTTWNRAALPADLPALRRADLEIALQAAARVDRGVVPDGWATGTTLLTARAGVPWRSAYGRQSYRRHQLLGHVPLPAARSSTLRWDVDTVTDLEKAWEVGTGSRTAALLNEWGVVGVRVTTPRGLEAHLQPDPPDIMTERSTPAGRNDDVPQAARYSVHRSMGRPRT